VAVNRSKPCLICEGTNYVWGRLVGDGLRFLKKNEGFLMEAFTNGDKIIARRCQTCRNIQIFEEGPPPGP
jgi:hypothetical protein